MLRCLRLRSRRRAATLSRPPVALLVLLAFAAAPAMAQTYRFRVPSVTAEVTPSRDGSAAIEYWITFDNDPAGDPIDVVDIGLPNAHYDLGSVIAECNATRCTDIRKSEYVDIGVEVHLGGAAIPPGERGELHLLGKCDRMVWQDTGSASDASIEFAPTFFDASCVSGLADITVRLILPPGTQDGNTRYHTIAPTHAEVVGDHVEYTWAMLQSSASSQAPTVGASFSAGLVDVVRQPSAADRAADHVPGAIGGAICLCPVLFIGVALVVGMSTARRRRMAYMPPSVKTETGGVRRGLSPAEAALVCETPLGDVAAMIAFSLMRQGVLRVARRDPTLFEVLPHDPNVLRPHEREFLKCIGERVALRKDALSRLFVDLIRATTEKMRGYHRARTAQHYRGQVEQCWRDLESAPESAPLTDAFAGKLEWAMTDPEFAEHIERVFGHHSVSAPTWWGSYNPDDWAQRDEVAGRPIPDFGMAMRHFPRVVVPDSIGLTRDVTAVTHPVPVSSASHGGGGGGHSSCACACACAGCACACAGGGR